MWLIRLLEDLWQEPKEATTFYEDNQSAMRITENSKDFGHLKHAEIDSLLKLITIHRQHIRRLQLFITIIINKNASNNLACCESPGTRIVSGVKETDNNQKTNFLVYYQNVRGLRTKIVKLRLLLTSCDYDVLVFTETWLTKEISSAEISPDYTLFRCDRSELTSEHTRGGGVLIAVKNHLHCEVMQIPNSERLEQTAVCIKSKTRSLYIISVYLPPSTHVDLYATHANAVQNIVSQASDADIVLSLGDFNLPKLCWELDDDINGYIPSNISSEKEQFLTETMFATGLRQINSFVSKNGNLLDLVFVSLPEQMDIFAAPTSLLPVDDHHTPVVLLIDVSGDDWMAPVSTLECSDAYDFNRCDYDQLRHTFSEVEWDHRLEIGTTDDAVSAFYSKLSAIFNDCVPRKRRVFNSTSNKPWCTSELRHLRNALRKARRRFFLTKSDNDRTILREVEGTYKSILLTTYESYIEDVQNNVKLNPSCFWDFVKKQKSAARIPCNVSYNNIPASSNSEAADFFSLFFESHQSACYTVLLE
nr:uncharacterized protein LOC115257802 [Aedes albopictus]